MKIRLFRDLNIIPGQWKIFAVLLMTFVLGTMLYTRSSRALETTDTTSQQQAVSHPPIHITNLQSIYLPLVRNDFEWLSPFGFEAIHSMSKEPLLQRANELNAGWIRMNDRISWRELQPTEDSPIQWQVLEPFEQELRLLRSSGIMPVVIVDDYPRWATSLPSSCSALRTDRLEHFARFMSALAERYSTPEFNVHHWELGNEPDVDPDLVDPDNIFGCWGDADDPFYGGQQYGAMLNVVTPALKAADPEAVVWIGGLLLNSPETRIPGQGRPELFVQGILEAGAAPHFDVVPYHWYPAAWKDGKIDQDNAAGNHWDEQGGGVRGKARHLRQIMQSYGVDKPLVLNETSLLCPPIAQVPAYCNPPSQEFFQLQATMMVRVMVRGLSEGVSGFSWYTLDGPGWRNSGLLDGNQQPRPAFRTYQHINQQLADAVYLGPVDYGPQIEAYAFLRGDTIISVAWSTDTQTHSVTVPQATFREAFDRDGNPLAPTPVEGGYQFAVPFEPVYLLLSAS